MPKEEGRGGRLIKLSSRCEAFATRWPAANREPDPQVTAPFLQVVLLFGGGPCPSVFMRVVDGRKLDHESFAAEEWTHLRCCLFEHG